MQNENESNTFICHETANKPMSLFHFIINGVATSALIAFEISGSLCSCRTLLKKAKNSRFAKYLLALCLWDIAVLTTTFGFYGFATLITGKKPWTGPFVYLYLVFYPLINCTMTGGKWTMMVITIERYFAMSRPFTQRVRESRPVKKILLMILFCSLLINLPIFLELSTINCYSKISDQIKSQISPTKLRLNERYILIYRIIILSIFENCMPFFLVLILTVSILLVRTPLDTNEHQSILLKNKKHNAFIQREMGNSYTATLLWAVIVKFLICHTAPTLSNIIEFFGSTYANTKTYGYLVDISNLLVIFHSATNWLLFRQWRGTGYSSSNSMKSVHKKSSVIVPFILDADEKCALGFLWSKVDHTSIGQRMIATILEQNETLLENCSPKQNGIIANKDDAMFLLAPPLTEWESKVNNCAQKKHRSGKIKEIITRNKGQKENIESFKLIKLGYHPFPEERGQMCMDTSEIGALGCNASMFLNETVNAVIDSKSDLHVIRQRVREIGQIHYKMNIRLRTTDWFIVKRFLVDQICPSGLSCPPNNCVNPYIVVNKFVSFLICELKCGFLCESVNSPKISTSAVSSLNLDNKGFTTC